VRVGWFLGYDQDADLAAVFFLVSTLECTLIGHVGFQPVTTDSRSNPTPEGFEPLTKSSRSNTPTNCTLWRHSAAMKACIKENGMDYKLVPSRQHRQNQAEQAIQTF
jgi:hypothetical protein